MATKSMKIGAAVLGGALIVGAAVAAGRRSVDSPKKPTANHAATTSTVPGGLVEFRDEKAGWAISYPQTWNRLQSSSADVVLVVSEKPPELNTGGSILARDLTLGAAVDEAKLPAAKEVTDGIVNGEGIQQLAQPTTVHQGGLPGYFYFYSFKDPTTGQEGVHTHYFLFKGSTMISFVFQALPKDSFQGLAHLYDQVVGSFRVIPPGGCGTGPAARDGRPDRRPPCQSLPSMFLADFSMFRTDARMLAVSPLMPCTRAMTASARRLMAAMPPPGVIPPAA
jgi:hypothetical protein